MSKLTQEKRDSLPDTAFVFPKGRKYPIHDEGHARAALSMVSQHGTDSEKAKVQAAVDKRYPGLREKQYRKYESPL